MANINGIGGLQTPSGLNVLIAAYGDELINLGTGMGAGFPINSTNNVEFENFLQSLFFQNYSDTPLSFNGTVWTRKHCAKVPLAKYMKVWNNRLYLGFVKLSGTDYPSRVWFSDLSKNNTIQWGFESGTNLSQTSGNTRVDSANAGFLTYNIKRGDPFYILTGPNIGEYAVQQVAADQQIILTTPLQNSSSGDSYWVGGNWIDFNRDDGDFVTWIEENYGKLIAFKRDSLFRYDGTRIVKIPGAVGTTSGRSVQNLHELTIYFYGGTGLQTGFYSYNGYQSNKISAQVEYHIQGINSSMYNSAVSWTEGNLYRCYVGDVTNTSQGISIPKAVFTYDYDIRAWSVDPISDVIKCSTQFRQSATKQVYLGNDSGQILLTPNGTTFNGNPIPWRADINSFYPEGENVLCSFTRVRVYSENANGTQVKFKLNLKPFEVDEEFQALGQVNGSMTELTMPESYNQASGISLQFTGMGTQRPSPLIKKVEMYYIPLTTIIS